LCRWLQGDDTGARPDRAHYVVDVMPDYVTNVDADTAEATKVLVIQVWVDPKHPDAHKDPALRRFLDGEGRRNRFCAIVRIGDEGLLLIPPSLTTTNEWIEKWSHVDRSRDMHSVSEIWDVLDEMGVQAKLEIEL
jgi:hypothetical protein